ncbi:MAG: hypothetical protein OXC80_08075 [Gammaproteobacteria bacterium]|nr:hypothetical protein [Gammaproteobacteria bacterium]
MSEPAHVTPGSRAWEDRDQIRHSGETPSKANRHCRPASSERQTPQPTVPA